MRSTSGLHSAAFYGLLTLILVMFTAGSVVAQEPRAEQSRTLISGTFPDPAVPMIQLPMEFKSQRVVTHAVVRKGESVDILNVKGPGAVRSLWQLFAQNLSLEITVDGAEVPQVNVPSRQFFGVMHNLEDYFINSAGIVVVPNPAPGVPGTPGYNCYMPIPFSESCRISIRASEDQLVDTMVNWHQYPEGTSITPFRFHAAYNVKTPAVPRDGFQMLEAEGRGFVAGLFMGAIQQEHSDMVFHTGGMRILIDGETDPHAIRGCNMEDDYGFTWGFNDRQTPWFGCPWHRNGSRNDQDGVFYRFFGPDPIAFHSSISLSTGCRPDDTESVVYYYRILGTRAPAVSTPTTWQVTDPFPGSDTWDGFQRSEFAERISGDSWNEQIREGEQVKAVHTINSDHTWLSLNRLFGQLENAAVYAKTNVDSDQPRKAFLRITSDDFATIWFNGRKIAELRHENGLETVRLPVDLQQGRNDLVIKTSNKLSNNRYLWALSCVVEAE